MTPRGSCGLAVLTYHSFGGRPSVTSTDPGWFAETVAALVARGYHGVDLAEWVARGRPDEPRGFALTFDDGPASLLKVVDTVAGYGLPATIFAVTDRVGTDNDWPGQPGSVAREPLLGWSDLNDLGALGFKIGAHGRTHRALDQCSPAEVEDELRGSCGAIEDRLGRPCPLLAYPYGRSSRRVRLAARGHFAASFGTRLDYAHAGQSPADLSRIDGFYVRSRSALEKLALDRWRGHLRWRRALRAVRGAGRIGPIRRAS